MATTSTMDELYANIDAMIATHVAAIEDHQAQIVALQSARQIIADNGGAANSAHTAPAKSARRRRKSSEDEAVKMVTEKQLLWLERKGYDGDNPEDLTREEASAILDERFNGGPVVGLDDDDEVEVEETPRQKRSNKASRTRTKRTQKSNGNGKSNGKSDEPKTRKDAIIALHEEGLKPKDIASELDANVSYVYLVLRELREAAK